MAIHIYSCRTYSVVATVKTPKEAEEFMRDFRDGTYDCFAMLNGKIVGCGTDGYTGESQSEMLPYHERCGSVMTGREH